MNKPSFSFNLVEVYDADGNVSYQIFTEDGDLVYDVAGGYMLATKLWLDRLSQSEREIWEDYCQRTQGTSSNWCGGCS